MEKELEKIIYLNALFDLYGELLSNKQKTIFKYYYEDNLSLSEIATNLNVSRNAIFDTIKKVENYLDDYENKIGLYNKIKNNKLELKKLYEEKHIDDYAYKKLKEE